MKHPLIALLALSLAVLFWAVATAKATQYPPLEILSAGRPIHCGKLENHLIKIRKRWKTDMMLMKKGFINPVFRDDWEELRFYEEMFILVPCRSI